ncbi:MAG: hypothetical protein LUF89_05785 [Ruminococcus sp.]|nr:hypothetical protein [Ruminococcus sp.]
MENRKRCFLFFKIIAPTVCLYAKRSGFEVILYTAVRQVYAPCSGGVFDYSDVQR